nr:immunoglobulin heavy chain junction region [Mus musculus]
CAREGYPYAMDYW